MSKTNKITLTFFCTFLVLLLFVKKETSESNTNDRKFEKQNSNRIQKRQIFKNKSILEQKIKERIRILADSDPQEVTPSELRNLKDVEKQLDKIRYLTEGENDPIDDETLQKLKLILLQTKIEREELILNNQQETDEGIKYKVSVSRVKDLRNQSNDFIRNVAAPLLSEKQMQIVMSTQFLEMSMQPFSIKLPLNEAAVGVGLSEARLCEIYSAINFIQSYQGFIKDVEIESATLNFSLKIPLSN